MKCSTAATRQKKKCTLGKKETDRERLREIKKRGKMLGSGRESECVEGKGTEKREIEREKEKTRLGCAV